VSALVAIAYPDHDTAERVRTALIELEREHVLQLDDLVVVTHDDDGRVRLHQTTKLEAAGLGGGALVGSAIGFLFLAPLVGMAVGAAAGAAAGSAADSGVDDDFMRELGARLEHGGAAVIALVRSSVRDEVLPRLHEFGGHVIHSELSAEQERSLRLALGEPAVR
jgi:uncharacterized membrane protein